LREETLIDKDLKAIADNINVITGKDKGTEKILKQMGLTLDDISDNLREEIKKVSEILTDTNKDPIERIDSVWRPLEKLSNDQNVPSNIRRLIFSTALRRLDDARMNIRWQKGEESTIRDIGRMSYNLDLFINDDKKTQMKLRKLGIKEVPEEVRKVALEAKAIMDNKKLDAKERALRAADVLTSLMTPAALGKRLGDIREVHKNQLQIEIKCILWEIANDLTYRAAKEESLT
jgi:uncharacterized protein (UPF0147 family)